MHDEFEIEYLKPYYERFGLVNYGCCEPLHNKIDLVRLKDITTVRGEPRRLAQWEATVRRTIAECWN